MKRKKAVRRRRAAKAAIGAAGQALSSLRQYRTHLIAERDHIDAQIRTVDAALHVMGAPAGAAAQRRGPSRPKAGATSFRRGSLKEYITRVMSGRGVMAVKDIAASVVRAGYKSKNKTLAKSVGIALTGMPNVSKVSRGRFRAR